MPDWINFAELRARVSLEEVLFSYYRIDTLRREGSKVVGPCPVHGGDSPRAFHADLDKNVWHCFSQCGRGGNQLDLIALKENIGIREAALRLQAFFLQQGALPVPVKPKGPATPAAPPGPPAPARTRTVPTTTGAEDDSNPILDVKLDLKGDHPHLLIERKLKAETVTHFGVGYCSRGIMRGMIAIPIHDEDADLVAFAGRRLKPSDIRAYGKYKLPKGFKKDCVLYNYHRAKGHPDGLVLVEGFFSVLKLYEAGLTNVVASMGCELSDHQARLLATAPEVIVLFDGDDAGRGGSAAVVEKLAPQTLVRVAQLPAGLGPDDLPAKALRWLVNGMRALDLVVVSFAFRGDSTLPTTPRPLGIEKS